MHNEQNASNNSHSSYLSLLSLFPTRIALTPRSTIAWRYFRGYQDIHRRSHRTQTTQRTATEIKSRGKHKKESLETMILVCIWKHYIFQKCRPVKLWRPPSLSIQCAVTACTSWEGWTHASSRRPSRSNCPILWREIHSLRPSSSTIGLRPKERWRSSRAACLGSTCTTPWRPIPSMSWFGMWLKMGRAWIAPPEPRYRKP